MPRVVHFEIDAADPVRASAFYTSVFGWKIERWGTEDYWLVTTGASPEPGIDGGIHGHSENTPKGTVNTVSVSNLDDSLAKVTANGGKALSPKFPIPTVGWLAYCADTEGNAFGMMQMDPNAG